MNGPRPRDRVGTWILVLATVVGVWVGLTAPEVSPVDPAAATATTATVGLR